jgi:hypothetical protein
MVFHDHRLAAKRWIANVPVDIPELSCAPLSAADEPRRAQLKGIEQGTRLPAKEWNLTFCG